MDFSNDSDDFITSVIKSTVPLKKLKMKNQFNPKNERILLDTNYNNINKESDDDNDLDFKIISA